MAQHKPNYPARRKELVKYLLEQYGQRTFAREAGIRLQNTPAPLFQLLILSLMLSARIASDKAVSATASLFSEGYTTPEKMADATWQQRVDAITWSGYKRYDERTATMLGETAERVQNVYHGDLRQLHERAEGDISHIHKLLTEFKGIGNVGANIFLREAQAVWDDIYPYADDPVLTTAAELDLPDSADRMSKLCKRDEFPRLTAALMRVRLLNDEQKIMDQCWEES